MYARIEYCPKSDAIERSVRFIDTRSREALTIFVQHMYAYICKPWLDLIGASKEQLV